MRKFFLFAEIVVLLFLMSCNFLSKTKKLARQNCQTFQNLTKKHIIKEMAQPQFYQPTRKASFPFVNFPSLSREFDANASILNHHHYHDHDHNHNHQENLTQMRQFSISIKIYEFSITIKRIWCKCINSQSPSRESDPHASNSLSPSKKG